jgi:putative transposase
MTLPRAIQVHPESTPYYHCVTRCVRQAFLLGEDRATGRRFDHRKQWVVDELATLERIFAVDVCAFAVMSNHVHLVLRLDPAASRAWTREALVRRARELFPTALQGAEAAGTIDDLLPVYRERLSSLSWFMRCLNERIARRANREDGCHGRFWEGRFKSRPLLDAGALLTCMSYVDLNPVRAGVAHSLAGSDFSSIQARLTAVGRDQQMGALPADSGAPSAEPPTPPQSAPARGPRLMPFEDGATMNVPATSPVVARLPFTLHDYVELVRFSGQAVRGDKRGALPSPLGALVRGVGLREEGWSQALRDLASVPFAALGERHLIDTEAARRGRTRACGAGWVRQAYAAPHERAAPLMVLAEAPAECAHAA